MIFLAADELPVWVGALTVFFYLIPVFILIGTWLIGRAVERSHFRQIAAREALWAHIPAISTKTLPDPLSVVSSEMVVGSVVISGDYFKRWLSSFRKIFGGEMKSYVTVIERGRREAILRMKESCPDADIFLNCRLETSTISNGSGKSIGCAEVLAYATAVRYQKSV